MNANRLDLIDDLFSPSKLNEAAQPEVLPQVTGFEMGNVVE